MKTKYIIIGKKELWQWMGIIIPVSAIFSILYQANLAEQEGIRNYIQCFFVVFSISGLVYSYFVTRLICLRLKERYIFLEELAPKAFSPFRGWRSCFPVFPKKIMDIIFQFESSSVKVVIKKELRYALMFTVSLPSFSMVGVFCANFMR